MVVAVMVTVCVAVIVETPYMNIADSAGTASFSS